LIVHNVISNVNIKELIPEVVADVSKQSKRIAASIKEDRNDSELKSSDRNIEEPKKKRARKSVEPHVPKGVVATTTIPTKKPSTPSVRWLALREVPGSLCRSDVAKLMEGIKLTAAYVCRAFDSPWDDTVFDVYIELETVQGAELGQIRSGEPMCGTDGVWTVESLSKSEAAWAKGVGVRLNGKVTIESAYTMTTAGFKASLLNLQPKRLSRRWQPVCRKALDPAFISDGSYGFSVAESSTPLGTYLRDFPSSILALEYDGISSGADPSDVDTPEVASLLSEVIEVWTHAMLKDIQPQQELCQRIMSMFQCVYEESWKLHYGAFSKRDKQVLFPIKY
jgi:hypothetical protein